jgi:ABC-2 type transport system ATP-binding protein
MAAMSVPLIVALASIGLRGAVLAEIWPRTARYSVATTALQPVAKVEPLSTHPAIRTEGLSKDYGSGHGLFDLDLEVERGEVFGFLGPNGAGKSTTMRLLLDLIKPTAGSASVLGLDTRDDSLEVHGRVGFLPGDFALYPKLTGAEVLDYLAELRGGVDRGLRDSLAERFDAQLDRPVRELSSGNRQKVGLIQAFMHEPELLILDEPIAGLDPLVQQSFHALLAEVSSQGRSVFLSSHTLSEVERVTHRVAILREGRLVVVDSLENLRQIAVQRLEIEFATPVNAEQFRALPGVREAKAEGKRVTVAFEGSADRIVKAAAAHEVRAIRTHEDDLEEIFLRYYREGASP